MTGFLHGWWQNPSFWSALSGWFIAQLTKMAGYYFSHRRWNFACLTSTGGMPSAHSCMVAALATSIGIRAGTDGPLFALALIFALIVMFDAQSVRRAAGMQARILNKIMEDFKERRFSVHRLEELLGHTRLEVLVGLVMGVLTATAIHLLFLR